MSVVLPEDRMPEAEVSLRLAFFILASEGSDGAASVAIDGAQVRVHGRQVFPIAVFLREAGWEQVSRQGKNGWQGEYRRDGRVLTVHASSGVGDVVAAVNGRRFRVECKQGPLVPRTGSREFPLLREALGQALTVEVLEPGDVMAVAVPRTDRFSDLVARWRPRPLVVRSGIQFALVGRDGTVEGLNLL